MTAQQIRQRLEMILDFMQPHWEFVNCHMVHFLTEKHWERFITQDLRSEVSDKAQVRLCIEQEFWQQTNEHGRQFPSVNKFVQTCRQHCLENFKELTKSTQDFWQEIGLQKSDKNKISVKEFLSDKKRHEVEIMADLVNELINSTYKDDDSKQNLYVIDAGDGKGYLSSRLALEYGQKVLGIDANETNTQNALERSKKLQRAWKGIVKRADLIQNGITPPRRGKKAAKQIETSTAATLKETQNYRTTATFIDTNLNLTDLLLKHFNFENLNSKPQICLTGLHTCGGLATTCLRVFNNEPNCRILCNIGCCYHFLKEAFTTSKWEHSSPLTNKASGEFDFPMSQFLREKQIKLGRNARMLAAQSVERTLAARELPNISLFYRALLEVLIFRQANKVDDSSESIQVGRIRKFNNFHEYLAKCSKNVEKFQLNGLEDEIIDSIETEFAEQRCYLELFYLLRMQFAPILESVILLDRVLYLKELGYERSYLVSAFDAIISPRHYAIIALRN